MSRLALEYYQKAGIVLTEKNIEVTNFGHNTLQKVGLEIVTHVNTDLVCAKEMVLLPN